VQWHNTAVEDELDFEEVVSTHTFTEQVSHHVGVIGSDDGTLVTFCVMPTKSARRDDGSNGLVRCPSSPRFLVRLKSGVPSLDGRPDCVQHPDRNRRWNLSAGVLANTSGVVVVAFSRSLRMSSTAGASAPTINDPDAP